MLPIRNILPLTNVLVIFEKMHNRSQNSSRVQYPLNAKNDLIPLRNDFSLIPLGNVLFRRELNSNQGGRTRLPKFKFSAKFPIGLHVILQIQIKKFENDCYIM